MAASFLAPQSPDTAASLRLGSSSVAPVYASALSYTHLCVIANANAYCVSRFGTVICSKGDRR
jgi:hypothetical protein